MGFINNQWLKGRPERNRPHGPIKAVLRVDEADHQWDKDNGVLLQLSATRENGDYQHILFTADEVQQFMTFVIKGDAASGVAIRAIASLPDSEQIRLLEKVLTARSVRWPPG